jgi:methionyl-tRNA synthetase
MAGGFFIFGADADQWKGFDMPRYLITSALPYINGVKHLGNLVGSLLPADIQARFRRQTGAEVLFLCATDEHGTPAELAARAAGLDVAGFCDREHARQAAIYRRFNLSFDHFGRTSSRFNRAPTQDLARRLDANGFIVEKLVRQAYSPSDGRFLPDRYVTGICPHCLSPAARGDQCESCTQLLDPADLIEPRSTLSGARDIELRPTRHLYLRQTLLADRLASWHAAHPEWPKLVRGIARAWLDQGLEDRCITRDLAWGVPVDRPGFEGKVFYVWFDAPIGYIGAAQEWASLDPAQRDWRSWWEGGEDVHYIQVLGKDNVPFHTVSFPATIIGSGLPLELADQIKGLSWLTFEGGKFSTSAGHGIFTDAALDLLPADYWRWWLAANAPEDTDSDFTLARFAADTSKDLADLFGNLVNRCLAFLHQVHDGIVPEGGSDGPLELALASDLELRLAALRQHHEALAIRKAVAEIRGIWARANAYLTEAAPWTVRAIDSARAAAASAPVST